MDFFSSVKLTLVLLAALAIASILGTIVPQDLPAESYVLRYGAGLYTFLYYLDVFDLYHAAWFNALLGLLMVNLLVCSIKRLPATLRLVRPLSGENVRPDFLKKQPVSGQALLSGSLETVLPRARGVFGRRFGRLRQVDAAWGVLLLAERGAYARFGVYVIHASLVFIMAGAVIGNLSGFEGRLDLGEGETGAEVRGAVQTRLAFEVRLDRFRVSYYPNGSPSEYRSDLAILESGREVDHGTVRVNHPLTHGGVTFYQQTFQTEIQGKVGLRVLRRADGRTFDLEAQPHQPEPLPGEAGQFAVQAFAHEVEGEGGPAARILVRTSQGAEYGTWAFENRPGGASQAGEPFTFELTRYRVESFSGLMVRRDPGVGVIYVGFGMLLAGFVLTYLFSHHKLYLGLIEQEGGVLVLAGGSAHRGAASFQARIEVFLKRLEPGNSAGKETLDDPC